MRLKKKIRFNFIYFSWTVEFLLFAFWFYSRIMNALTWSNENSLFRLEIEQGIF
jgi:hypothetical protein